MIRVPRPTHAAYTQLTLVLLLAACTACTELHGAWERAQLSSKFATGLCTKGSDGKPTGPAHDRARITQLETYIEGKPGMVKIALDSGRPEMAKTYVNELVPLLPEWDARIARVVNCDGTPATFPYFAEQRRMVAEREEYAQLDRAVKRNAWEQARRSAPPPAGRPPKVLVSVPIGLEACFQNLDANLVGTELRVSFTSICRTRNPIVLSVRFALYNERGRVGLFDSAAAFAVTLRTASILSDMAESEQATTGVEICHMSDCVLQEKPSLSFHLERLLPVEVLRSVTAIEVALDPI